MSLFPQQSNNIFNSTGDLLGGASQPTESNFTVAASAGFGSQEGTISPYKPAVSVRQMMHWLVPEGPIVQMYINPQSIYINEKKLTNSTRTKGGYVVQYWGEEFTSVVINGTTGSSGIEGINVLRDIYRNEQLQFDPFALAIAAQYVQNQNNTTTANSGSDVSAVFGALLGAAEATQPAAITNPPTLASLATGIELYWSGEVFRGYFTSFSVEESAERLGLFNYVINFTVTQRRGIRLNFLPHHRSPNFGPSNSNPEFGRPYSFGQIDDSIIIGNTAQPTTTSNAQTTDLFDLF